MVDTPDDSANLITKAVDIGVAGANEVACLGGDNLLAALLSLLGRSDGADKAGDAQGAGAAEGAGTAGGAGSADATEPPSDDRKAGPAPEGAVIAPVESITRGMLTGEGRYTYSEVAERAGIPPDEAGRLWRALGFPDAGHQERAFTSADVAALAEVNRLVEAGIVDSEALVDLARPMGNLMARIAAAQTHFIAEVLGAKIAEGLSADDPQLPSRLAAQALVTTRELLPVLELTTIHAWRRHLAAEVGRALNSSGLGLTGETESRPAAVGFIDMSGYTRLSRSVELDDLGGLLNRFETVVLDAVVDNGGRVIKNLGDEILFVVDDPVSAAEATLRMLDASADDEDLPPMHAGLAFGPVLERGGDVYGPVVNVAARLASLARKGTIRVDQGMATALADADQFALSVRTPRHVRGYLQLPNYRLKRSKKH